MFSHDVLSNSPHEETEPLSVLRFPFRVRAPNVPRLFRVLVSEHDEGIAEILTGLIQMGAGAGTTVLTVVPETVLEEDFLNLAIRVCEFRTVFAIPAAWSVATKSCTLRLSCNALNCLLDL